MFPHAIQFPLQAEGQLSRLKQPGTRLEESRFFLPQFVAAANAVKAIARAACCWLYTGKRTADIYNLKLRATKSMYVSVYKFQYF